MVRWGALKSVLTGSACVLLMATAAHAQTRAFNVPAGDLRAALDAYADQSGVQLIYRSDDLRGVRTTGVRGSFDAAEALNDLLTGTGFVVQRQASGAIAIVRNGRPQSGASAQAEPPEAVSEVVVTGTRIRGAAPASPVITLTGTDIQRSGYTTVGEVIRNLPQNFAGGENYTVFEARGGQSFSLSFPSSVNLRGLGSAATLTLLDGHRLPGSEIGQAPDISAIPAEVIDRIEVVTDGASALYGSDAVGGVVNFILKKRFEGAVSSATVGQTTGGGGFEQRYNQLLGTSWDSGGAIFDYEFFDADPVLAGDRRQLVAPNVADPSTLLPSVRRHSVFARADQQLGGKVTLFAEGVYNHRQTDFAFETTPFRHYSATATDEQYAVFGGLNAELPAGWSGSVTGSHGGDHGDYLTELTTSSFDLAFPSSATNRFWTVDAEAEGPLANLPGGQVRAALAAGYRREMFEFPEGGTSAHRGVEYAAGEILVPIIGEDQGYAGVRRLELSAAVRAERYSDFGSTVNPKFGVIYSPVDEVRLRGTWGKSFHAPSLFQQHGQQQTYLFDAPNPAEPTGSSIVLFNYGANPDLKPERATSWTVGVDVSPRLVSGSKVGVTYYSIDYTGRIAFPADFADLGTWLTSPVYASFLTPNPSADLQAQVIGASTGLLNLAAEPYDPATVDYLLDGRYQNVASQTASGVDLDASYAWSMNGGTARISGNATWLNLKQRNAASAPIQQLSGRVFHPSNFRARATLSWDNADWSLATSVNHLAPSVDDVSTPQGHIDGWTTVDLTAGFRGFGHGVEISASVVNLFDTDPPRIPVTTAPEASYVFDSTKGTAAGRIARVTVKKRW